MQPLKLKPLFVDRGGRTVYSVLMDDREEEIVIGQIRLKPFDHEKPAEVEWFNTPAAPSEQELFPRLGGDFVPGHVPDQDEPGPHSGGTG